MSSSLATRLPSFSRQLVRSSAPHMTSVMPGSRMAMQARSFMCKSQPARSCLQTFASTNALARSHMNLGRAMQRRGYAAKVEDRAKDRNAVGPFNIRAAALFVLTGVGLFVYFRSEKAKVEQRKVEEQSQAKIGRPKIGGPFELLMPTPISDAAQAKTVEARRFTHEDLQDTFSLIYFGFTNCPDICPEELDKMAQIVDNVDAKHGPVINPVFITCDPARDTLAATSIYVSEFHPRLIGLTGSYEAVKEACKAYRVYFSTPPSADPSGDYLVDHSIFFYLMDPQGKFVDAFGRSVNAEEATTKVLGFIDQWKASGNAIGKADAKERVLNDESRKAAATGL